MTESNYSLSNMLKLPTSTTSKPISTSCSVKNQSVTYSYSNYVPIGYGTFGTVYKAKCDQTGEDVAIKRVFQDVRYKNRELQILQELNHINVVKLKNYFYTLSNKNANEKFLNVVMDYYPDSLSQIIRMAAKSESNAFLPFDDIKLYAYQMFHGLNYLDAIGVCHRDIKPQNILVDQDKKILQFCDFGSAKKLKRNEPNVSYICSRYYRAPELIFNAEKYTNAIDMWSVGCVIAEMVLGYPIFQGENSVDQLVEIIKVLGTPKRSEIREMNPDYTKYKFPLVKCYTLKEIFQGYSNIGSDFINLLQNIFVYNPEKRIKPLEALCHPFFDSLRQKNVMTSQVSKVLFSFSQEEIDNDPHDYILNKLIPKWYTVTDVKEQIDEDSD